MIKKLIFSTLLLTLFSTIGFAQGSKLKRAKAAMEALNYVGAIEMYNQILEKDDNAEAKIQLAECYRKISDSENAEYWYGQVVRLPEAESVHKLYYGQSLQRNGKCDLAREWYEQFIREVPGDIRGQYLVKACDYQDELMTKSAGVYEITHMDFNSNLDDFSPTIYGDQIVFASERDKGSSVKRAHCWTGNPFLELYNVKAKGSGTDCKTYETGKPTKFSKKLNSKYHDAAVGFNSDESKIFFTRNNFDGGKTGKSDDGIIKLKVYSADVAGEDNFTNVEGLPFNSDEYSVAHPTLNADGTNLYFASDMPGGFGGMDLYVSEEENGRWGPPMNLGPMVNTEGNEVFPYYNAKDSRLYFSSDGQIGIGGLDIYHITEQEDGEFTLPENIGYPVNTISDDFGIVFDKEGANGFFSSDREGGVGRDDIYSFCKIAAPVEVFVYDEATGDPIEGATVINDCTGSTLTTDSEGKAIIEMKLNECCTFAASSEGYEDNEQEGCTTEVTAGETVFVEIPLSQESLYLLEGVVFDQNSGLPLEGASVMLESDCEDEEFEEIVTDATGRFEFPLGADCCYKVKAGKDGYFGNPIEGQCTRGLTEATTLQANLNLAPISGPAGPGTVGTNPVIVDNGNPPPSTPITRGGPCDIYKDMDKGLYVSAETGEPFTGDCGGVTYVNGNPNTSFPTTTTTTGTVTTSTTFEPSGTSYTDANAGYLMHVYYDFDRAYLRDESTPELEKLCTMMKNQPDLVVEIASHTDSRGSNNYNYRLSQRRAEAVTRYLCDVCGISKDRLVPRGYGETKNVNRCANKIPCSEQEHQMNRRTEFRVIGCLSCYNNAETKLSAPNPSTKVSSCQGCPF